MKYPLLYCVHTIRSTAVVEHVCTRRLIPYALGNLVTSRKRPAATSPRAQLQFVLPTTPQLRNFICVQYNFRRLRGSPHSLIRCTSCVLSLHACTAPSSLVDSLWWYPLAAPDYQNYIPRPGAFDFHLELRARNWVDAPTTKVLGRLPTGTWSKRSTHWPPQP